MGMRIGRQLLAALVLCMATAVTAAAQTGTISGRVSDAESGAPLASASVEVVATGGRVVATGLTDGQGNYRLTNVPAGTYALVFMLVGYGTQRIEAVRVIAGESTMTGAMLTSSAFQLNPVVVSASKRQEKALEAPANVQVVSEREIASRPAVSPVDHLRNNAAIDVISTGVQSNNVVVRGFNNIFSGSLHTLTDYRIASVPSLRVNFMHFVPQNNEDIARMEVVLGPGSALYGPNTANGVLHMITKSPLEEQGTSLSFAGGDRSLMHGTFRTAHRLSDRFGVKVSGQYLQADEWQFTDTTEVSAQALARGNFAQWAATQTPGLSQAELQRRAALVGVRDFDIQRWSGDVRADWRPTDNFTAVLSGGMTNASGIELTGIGAGQAQDWKYSYAQLRANYGSWFAQTYVNMSDAGDTYLIRTGAPIVDKSKVWVSQLQNSASIGTRQNFVYGVDFISTMPETEGTINGARENDDNYNEFGAYIQSQTALHRMFDVVLAGRYDKHSELEDAVFSPRAALVFKPNQNHNFRVTYNRAFSTPTSLNLFLDIDAGPLGALGPFGYRVHAQAPGRQGISLRTNGELMVRSPFSGNQLRAITSSNLYSLQLETLIAASAARGQPLPASIIGYMRDLAADPALAQVGVFSSDPLAGITQPFNAAAIPDVAGIKESTTSTVEVGYKGLIGDRLLLAADAWWSRHKNFTSPLIAATPLLLLNPTQLGQFLVPRLTQATGSAQTAQTIAQTMAALPGGIISSDQVNGSGTNLMVTYVNFGEVDLSGVDLSATAILNSQLQFSVSGSLVSDDFFKLPLAGQDSQAVALNAPKRKATAALTYRNTVNGLSAEGRVRYTDEFPANSAGYVGLRCVEPTATGECVKSFTVFDVSAGYRLPIPGASLQLSVNNLFDADYRNFIGTPSMGRMAILRLRYDM